MGWLVCGNVAVNRVQRFNIKVAADTCVHWPASSFTASSKNIASPDSIYAPLILCM